MKPRTWIVVVCCLLLAASAAAQQAFYGSIVGNVTDPTGAVVPGAAVTVTNVLTGVNIEVKSSEAGTYQALNLNPGTYKVRVGAAGFQNMLRENVILQAGQQVRVDAKLTVGSVDQTVQVTDVSPQINTESATTTIPTITHHNTVTLPNNNAATFPDIYNQLLSGYADVNNAAFSIGGTLSSQNAEVQDGMRIDGQSNYVGGNRGLARPSIESVEEVVVTTATPSAKYPQAAAIETVMRSGTNALHGSAWYDNGNSGLNAPNYFTHKKAFRLVHHGGGSLGGPIQKDKTFFLFSYQGFREPAMGFYIVNIPSVKMRAGDLSDFLTPGYAGRATPIQLIDPLNGQPFANNRIPDARISPIAKKFLDFYPQPNRDEGLGYQRDFINPYFVIRSERNWDVRLDRYWKPTEHSYVRWTRFRSPNAANQTYLPGYGGNYFIMDTNIITAHHTSTLKSNLINHLMFGIFREDDPLGGGLFKPSDTVPAYVTDLGIPGIPADQLKGVPWFSFAQTALHQPYTWFYNGFYERFIHIADDMSWVKNRHNIQFGGEFRVNTQGSDKPGGGGQLNSGSCMFGCFNFNGRWTGLDFADFLLGYPNNTTRYTMLPPDYRHRREYGGFIQDDFKFTSRLTLNFGLRYDYFPVFTSENGFLSMFNPAGKQFVVPDDAALGRVPAAVKAILPFPVVTAGTAGVPEALIETPKHLFSPRFGFAYRAMKDTVFRGGFGVYRSPLVSTGRSLFSGLFALTENFPDVQPAAGAQPLLTLANPFQTAGKASAAYSFFSPETKLSVDLHYSWNFAMERQVGENAFTVEYSAKRSVIPWRHNINFLPASPTPYSASRLPFPTLGSVDQISNGAHYSYNALRLNAKRRMAKGLFFDVAYVYSKTVDDLGGISSEVAGSSEDPFNRARDRGESSFMPPHRMTVNYVWQAPFGRAGSRLAFDEANPAGKFVNYVIKGWEISGTYNFQKPAPLNVSGSYRNAAGQIFDAPNTNRTSGRPNCTGASFDPPSGYIFNPAAFDAHVAPGTYGTCGRGILRYGSGSITVNQAVYRNFRIPWFVNREQGATFRLGVQMFNAINHSNVPNPITNMDNALFGKRSGNRNGETRTMILQARIEF